IQATSPLSTVGSVAASATASATGAVASCASTSNVPVSPATPTSRASPSTCIRVFHPEDETNFMEWASTGGLERIGADLAGADADDLVERDDEHLAVADLAGACRAADRLERRFEGLVGHGGLDLELGQ